MNTDTINTNNRKYVGERTADCRNTVAQNHMSDLHSDLIMLSERGNLITTSLKVASYFEKEHKNVIQSIRNIILNSSAEISAQLYYSTTYRDSLNREQEMYVMSFKGFLMLSLGFTGKKAMMFRWDFINEFENLRNKLKAIQKPKIEYHDKVLNPLNTVTTTIIAYDLGMSARTLNKILQKRGIIYKMKNGTWMITSKYVEKGYAKLITDTFFNAQLQKEQTTHTLKWTEVGRQFINNIINPQQISA